MTIVALIPARGGSKRIPRKNVRLLGGKPLIQWTIDAAKASGIFEDVIVSSDDPETNGIAMDCDDVIVCPRPPEFATDASPDIEWVRYTLRESCENVDAFAILRPTSPFRDWLYIQTVWHAFSHMTEFDSVRSVRIAKEHPGKMWRIDGNTMTPALNEQRADGTPWHSSPTQSLPTYYTQTASLEMAWTHTVTEKGSIAGDRVAAYIIKGWNGFDINTPEDWDIADAHARHLLARV